MRYWNRNATDPLAMQGLNPDSIRSKKRDRRNLWTLALVILVAIILIATH